MNVIITEDIIRNALNESIDEFILEEGMLGNGFKGLQNWWNNGNGQKIKNGLSNAWNGYKNFLAMYMDNKTNGQWNNKYGIYANGSGKTTELYYLQKWFGYHLDEIRGIARRVQDPSSFSKTEIEWERDSNDPTKQRSTQTIYKYEDIPTYAKNMITPYNFNMWIKNFIKDRESLRAIDGYIEYCSKHINDINSAIKLLNVTSFMSSKLGQYYLKRDKESQVKSNPTQKASQQSNNPVPNNKNGTFNYGKIECPQKRGWYYSTDAYGRNILVNSDNPTQAEFV